MKKYVGQCDFCGVDMHHDDDEPVSDESNVGDYDFICYPCQFKAMEDGTWKELVASHPN